MKAKELQQLLLDNPVIAAVHEGGVEKALSSPAAVLFCLKGNILTLPKQIAEAKKAGKPLFLHVDLAEGVGKDKAGIAYLASLGIDGIISTRTQLIKYAKECNLLTVQRFFALDSQGVEGIAEALSLSSPDFIEIMPGVIGKLIKRFADGRIPVIAGGLIEKKSEVEEALSCGALAVSTGKNELWYQ